MTHFVFFTFKENIKLNYCKCLINLQKKNFPLHIQQKLVFWFVFVIEASNKFHFITRLYN